MVEKEDKKEDKEEDKSETEKKSAVEKPKSTKRKSALDKIKSAVGKVGEKKDEKKDNRKNINEIGNVWNVIKFPYLTEKSVGLIEKENKLVFFVDRRYGKDVIKKAVEKFLNAKVVSVNTLIDRRGYKKAYVKLSKEVNASDVATRLGML